VPVYKGTLFYGFQKSGASVSFYSAEGAYANHAAALGNFYREIVPPFAALLGYLCTVEGVRVSDITIRGDSRVISIGAPVGPGLTYSNIGANNEPNDGNSCIVINWNNGATHRGRTFLRFYPDNLAEGGRYSPGTNYPHGIGSLRVALLDNQWGFLAKASNSTFKIVAMATNGPSPNVLKITAPGHTVLSGQPFRLGGLLPKIGSPNGVWEAASVSGNDLYAAASTAFSAYTWAGKGTVSPLGKTVFLPQTSDVLTRIRTRKSGRPFDSAVGRRRSPA
jgi:hypothetical protein